jgi:hypothetical protein
VDSEADIIGQFLGPETVIIVTLSQLCNARSIIFIIPYWIFIDIMSEINFLPNISVDKFQCSAFHAQHFNSHILIYKEMHWQMFRTQMLSYIISWISQPVTIPKQLLRLVEVRVIVTVLNSCVTKKCNTLAEQNRGAWKTITVQIYANLLLYANVKNQHANWQCFNDDIIRIIEIDERKTFLAKRQFN